MATLAGSKIISVDTMSQSIDLKRYLDRDASITEKKRFIEVAIERINNRTLDHETIHGGRFKKYSPEYAARKGVAEDNVDLFLKGDMLNSIEGEYDETNIITIKVVGATQIAKAYNHHVGDTLKKRPWFGITTDEARNIASQIKESSIEGEVSLASLLALEETLDETTDQITEETLASIIAGIKLEID